ncbi:AEC family transporter [Haloplanus halophilus]|uniref:AEC family transporter n=1 Tax=Haloplanus halophilus TaxID=2949993 RepID=UPI00203E6F80|nr:AEC family transporter [Haloplanus sp. GDY1]
MNSLFSIFATAILPIVALAGVGVVLGRLRDVDIEPLNTVAVYVLVPALIFHSIATASFGGPTLVRIGVATAAYLLAMVVIAEAVGRLTGESEPILSALVLVSAFPNSGNFGIPLSEFAFGADGRSTAVLFLTVQSVLIYTGGVYVAQRSGGTRGLGGTKRALKIPLVYAVVAALLARGLGLVPPPDSTAMATLELVGNAAIPLLLLILGIQLSDTDYGAALASVGKATVLKLGVAPLVGAAIALAVGFRNPTVARTFVLECATPAAITPLLLVVEFGGESVGDGLSVAEYVSTTVLVTTVLSVPLLTLLIALLESGLLV